MKAKRLLQLSLGSILCAACIRGTLMHHFEHIDPEGWDRSDTLLFQLPPITHEGHFQFDVNMRYTNSFPYKGIWMVAETRLNHPVAARRDTLYMEAADERGIPVGDGLNLLQLSTPLYSLHLEPGQEGTLRLYHLMRPETMPGIREIGIKVTEASPN